MIINLSYIKQRSVSENKYRNTSLSNNITDAIVILSLWYTPYSRCIYQKNNN